MPAVHPRTVTAHLAILGANIIYGLNYVIAKGIMPDYMEPRGIIFLRGAGAMVLFWALAYLFPKEKVEKKDLGRIAIAAFFGVFTNQVLFFEGLNLTTPINAAIIVTVIPVLVLVFAHLFLKERITSNKWIGIILGMAGAVMVILTTGNMSLQSATFTGNVLVFINAAAFALYLVLIKPLMTKYHPMTVIRWIFIFGIYRTGLFRVLCTDRFRGHPFRYMGFHPLRGGGDHRRRLFSEQLFADDTISDRHRYLYLSATHGRVRGRHSFR